MPVKRNAPSATMPTPSISQPRTRTRRPAALLCAATALLAPTLATAQLDDVPLPPDAPTVNCTIIPNTNPATLFTLSAPATFVFACNKSPDHPTCYAEQAKLDSKNTQATQIIATGETQGKWTCAFYDGAPGWLPTASLSPLPLKPAPPLNAWIGWYHQGKPVPGFKDDRLLIQPGKSPGTLHVSGRAYWYGANDNVHLGGVNADATPVGRFLHVVDGNGEGACVLDLVLDSSTHTLSAYDNMNCGGMNVRLWGQWNRFTPTTRHNK